MSEMYRMKTVNRRSVYTMIFEKLVALIAEQFNVDEDSITIPLEGNYTAKRVTFRKVHQKE